ncbi:MAG: WD40 repeat domain-containing protein [Planctomycetaceae bacterium]|nr:WD40 repeat domain-containing protein [Planctomycetaceae bacterium]
MDRAVRVWDIETGEERCVLQGFLYEPRTIAVSQDGQYVAAAAPGRCDWCGEVHVWEIPTGRLVRTLRGVGVAEGTFGFLPASTTLALPLRGISADSQSPKYLPVKGGVLLLWDFVAETEQICCSGQHRATAVAVSSNGLCAVACQGRPDQEFFIQLIHTADRSVRGSIHSEMSAIESLDFSADGTMLAANARGSIPRLWNVEQGSLVPRPEAKPSAIRDAVFFGANYTLFSFADLGHQSQMQILSAGTVEPATPPTRLINQHLIGAARSSDGQAVAWWDSGPTIRLWRAKPPGAADQLTLPFSDVVRLAFSPAGDISVVGKDAQGWHQWRGRETVVRPIRSAGVIHAAAGAVSPDGTRLATWRDGNTVTLWQLPEGELLQQLTEPSAETDVLEFSDNGKFLAHAQQDGTIIVRNLDDGIIQSTFRNPTFSVQLMKLSHDGRLLAIAGKEGGIDIWHAEGGQLMTRYFNAPVVTHLVFTADGRHLITAGHDGAPCIWGVFTESRREFLGGHSQGIHAIAISDDGRTLATGGVDQSVRCWHVSTGQELLSFPELSAGVTHLAFSRDGNQLAAVLADGSLTIWDSRTDLFQNSETLGHSK